MNAGWVRVFSSGDLFKIEMIKALLQRHNIECVILNKQDSVYFFGEAEIYVLTENSFEAKQLIVKNFPEYE